MTLTLKARVRGGRLLLDEPVDLPEGTEVELVPVDEGEGLDDADRARLHEALRRSADECEEGARRAWRSPASTPPSRALKRYRVDVSPEARLHVRTIQAWWTGQP